MDAVSDQERFTLHGDPMDLTTRTLVRMQTLASGRKDQPLRLGRAEWSGTTQLYEDILVGHQAPALF